MGKLQLTRSNFLTTQKQKAALKFARDKHRGQVGIDGTWPYINHCIEVARILHRNDYSEDIIVAGLLHDTLNKSDTSLEEISLQFGEDVSQIVEHLVESSDPTLTWIQRKFEYIRSITDAPEGSVVVSVADNLQISSEILQIWFRIGDSVFLTLETSKENYKWYFRSLAEMYFIRGLFFENQALLELSRKFTEVIASMRMWCWRRFWIWYWILWKTYKCWWCFSWKTYLK